VTTTSASVNRAPIARLLLLLALLSAVPVCAQRELLPIDHPVTRTLIRLYEYGAIPTFQREHLPVSRGAALELMREAYADTTLPWSLRLQVEYYFDELLADNGGSITQVVIPNDSSSYWIGRGFKPQSPWAIAYYNDPDRQLSLTFEPVLDGELRSDPDQGLTSMIFQGGAQLRGTIAGHVGFSSRITNGSIAGDTTLPLRDPRFKRSGKFGVIGAGRDIDFGSAHFRVDFDQIAVDIAREKTSLGGGGEKSLLVGSILPSNFDWLRLSAHFGRVSFTHLHGSLMPDVGSESVGVKAHIPSKYIAAHLLSVGPFSGVRFSLGESLIYSSRPFEIGYINPLNFLKSQEHYLRDRDNSNIYGALSVNPLDGLFIEGEFLLDDLKFSQIGNDFWGNKTAWRIGTRLTAMPVEMLDAGVALTHLEPYVYSHFNDTNAYSHDGAMLSGAGVPPNSYLVEGSLRVIPIPNLRMTATVGVGEHGANVMGIDSLGRPQLVRNVGGDIGFTRDADRDSDRATFLDGVREDLRQIRIEAEYEPVRNVYIRALYLDSRVAPENAPEQTDTQIWFGIRVGAY
jgi:hypothetical protein